MTQSGLDPKFDDIGHLRADQSTEGVIGWFGLFSLSPGFKSSHESFESYRLQRHQPGHNRNLQTPIVLATRATRKTTRFLVHDAKCNATETMHRARMSEPESQLRREHKVVS
jgi:hypothetical protein